MQHVAAGDELRQRRVGRGANNGLHTLQPYDAAMAKDGTVYVGLQDNGEGKIDARRQARTTVFGGDGFFTAVDPDNADTPTRSTRAADIAVTTDGGKKWTDIQPSDYDAAVLDAVRDGPERRQPPDDRRPRRRGDDRRAGRRHGVGHVDQGLRPRHAEAPGRRERVGGRRRPGQPALGGRRADASRATPARHRAPDDGLHVHRRGSTRPRRRQDRRPGTGRSCRAPTRTTRSRSAPTTATGR